MPFCKMSTAVFQRVDERITITVDVVGFCPNEDQSYCVTRTEVFSVKWCICVFLSLYFAALRILKKSAMNLCQLSITQRFEIGHQGDSMTEFVPMSFWSIVVNSQSDSLRLFLNSVISRISCSAVAYMSNTIFLHHNFLLFTLQD